MKGYFMINFLPVIYEDELLYSVIARYQRMCGIFSAEALVKDLFGKKIILRSTFFPQHINNFVSNLPPNSRLTSREIIMNHTMFPFYTAFLSEEKAQLILQKMAKGCGKGIETVLGFGGSKVKMPKYLRYCPTCFKDDIANLGESYFRRTHQIIGAFYCSKHRVLLKHSNVLSTQTGRDFICADEDNCNDEILSDSFSPKTKELNLQYIRNAEGLLKGDYPRKELEFIISFYIDILRDKGLTSSSGNLYMNDVESRFLHHYPVEYLKIMQSEVDLMVSTNWLRAFVRNNNKNRSPLRHLLYLQFLGVGVDEFFNANKVIGKKSTIKEFAPIFDISERREKWLKLIEENKGATRNELKEKGKGLHTWIFRHDREWYEKVTPRVKVRKPKTDPTDWEKRDNECLQMAKEAVQQILNADGKPIRVTPASVRLTVGARNWFNNKKLIRTRQYLQEVREDLTDFRIRKIKWAIDEMSKQEGSITAYKVQLYAGFGGGGEEVRGLIEKALREFK